MTNVSVDILIEMIKCCYFVGNCKLCPFYKAPKFGMIGTCMGPKKVGEALLNFMISVKAKEEAEQMQLFEAAQERYEENKQTETEDAGCQNLSE